MPTGYPGSWRHGTVYAYNAKGCRCEQCAQARREYYGNQRLADHLASIEASHGTESRYRRGCRCDPCKSTATAARTRRRKQSPVSTSATHGRAATYSNGCRCQDCRAAHTVNRRAQRSAARELAAS